MLLRLIFTALMMLVSLTPLNAEAQRMIANKRPLSAYVKDNFRCQETIPIFVNAPNRLYFQTEINKIRTIVYLARAALEKDCTGIKKINISGMVNKKQVYKGYISSDTQWKLTKDLTGQKTITVPRSRAAGVPYMNNHNELVVYDSDPFTISSPFKSKAGRLKVFDHINTLNEWCDRSIQYFLLEFDGNWKHRNSYFEHGFENFFLNKIFPTIKPLYNSNGNTYEAQTYLFFMRNRNEKVVWDTFKIFVKFYHGTHDIKSINKSYSLVGGRAHITGKERQDLYNKMNKRYLINTPGEEIYKDNLISIYPHSNGEMINFKTGKAGWCEKAELNIVYKMSLKERDKKITFDYLSPIVFNILKQHCDVPSVAYLYFYPENKELHWDETMYQYCKLWDATDTCRVDNTKLEYGFELGRTHGPLQASAMAERFRKNPYYLWDTEKGVFGNLPGGIYMNAIYEKDLDTIRKMDNLAHRELVGRLRGFETQTGLYKLGLKISSKVKPVSLILEVANQYMYHYQYNNLKCLRSGYYSKTFTHTADTIRYENMYGQDLGSVGGWTASTTYQVNQEFRLLLNELGKFSLFADVEVAAGYLKLSGLKRTGQDVKALQKKFDCSSPEVKRFERNLILLATQYLNNGNSFGKRSVSKSDKSINTKKIIKKSPPKPPVPASSKPKFAGSWHGTIDSQPIEIVLWPYQNYNNSFVGLAYAPKHDCLMYADVRKGNSLFELCFGKNNVITRKNNCILNMSELNGRYSKIFQAGGYVSADKNSGKLIFKATNFYLGKKIVDGEKIIELEKTSVSLKMLEFLNSNDGIFKSIGKPGAKLLSGQ